MICNVANEVLYPIPKNCVVCREKFYVGMKIKKTSNNITRYYNTNEKERIILYLDQKFLVFFFYRKNFVYKLQNYFYLFYKKLN